MKALIQTVLMPLTETVEAARDNDLSGTVGYGFAACVLYGGAYAFALAILHQF